ncbi:MAG: hypothetical protein AAF418_00750 [Pseudomonadota bacterium]
MNAIALSTGLLSALVFAIFNLCRRNQTKVADHRLAGWKLSSITAGFAIMASGLIYLQIGRPALIDQPLSYRIGVLQQAKTPHPNDLDVRWIQAMILIDQGGDVEQIKALLQPVFAAFHDPAERARLAALAQEALTAGKGQQDGS